ncbi:MAG TPA: sulfatase-like hydrolase/transferase [Thermoanaerobaculia bacterium]|nr:sulfatase-like hydrolase/transferase [Thermoanaerobaculia bacterium]
MGRRTVVGLLVLAAGLSACRRETAAASRPAGGARVPRDVVLITIDTLRADAVGFDGNTRGTTPNLDRFAAEGRVFTQAHSHNVITLPSHTNILTGMLPYQHGVRENAGFRLSPKIPTAASRLKAKGYTTGAFVAAYILDSRYGLNHDFDVYTELYRHLDQQLEFNIQQAQAESVVQAALAWYRSQEGKRRFLWVHLYDPHAPYEPPQAYKDKYPDDFYLGEVAYTDASLAPLLETLRQVQPPPLVVVTGDHGESRGEHGELTHGLFCYEATLHVPLFVWSPGLVAPGRDDVWARHIDILPTVLDALGEPQPAELTGQSLLPADRKEADAGSYFEALSAAFNRGWAPLRGMAFRGDKYIDLPIQELYDLHTDPAEAKNLAGDGSDALRRLRKRLLEVPAATLERGTIGSDEAAKLRSLGYLTGSAEHKQVYGPADDPKTLIEVDQTIHKITGFLQEGDYDQAEKVARQVVAANPKMALGYLNLAFALQGKHDIPGAIRVLEKASAQGAGGENMDRHRALLLSEAGRGAEAVTLLEPYRESEDPESLNAIGIALTDAGRPAEALPYFSRSLELDPSGADAHQNTGIALLKMGRDEEARHDLEAALRFGKRHARAWNALGVAWMRLGDPKKAIEAWQQCLEINPEQYDALYNIGRVAGQVKDWKTARAALEKFVATAPPREYARDIAEVRSVLADMKRQGI